MRVLIVEDEQYLGPSLRRFVDDFVGGEVILTTTIAASLPHVRRDVLHGAIIDVGLPDGSGLDLLEHIRAVAPAVRALVLTAICAPDVVIRSRRLGARYIYKPAAIAEVADFLVSDVYGPDAFDALLRAAVRRIARRCEVGSQRHQDVLYALAMDDRRGHAALDLGMSMGTLKIHLAELCERLDAEDARQLGAIVRMEARHALEKLAPRLLVGEVGRKLTYDR